MGNKKCRVDGCSKQSQEGKGGVCIKHGATHKRCSVEGCTNQSRKGGVCVRHGAKVKQCSSEGCPNQAQRGGVCKKHGAEVKRCSSEGCTNQVQKGGVCKTHGAKVTRKLCSSEGCTNEAQNGGVCIKHGAKVKQCSVEGCTNQARKGGVCMKHGATAKRCSSEGCPNQVVKGGVCWKHGANKRKTTNEAVEEPQGTSLHLIEQEDGDEVPSVDQRTLSRAKKRRRRVSSAATSSTDTEEEEMAANADEQAEETSPLTRRSTRLSNMEKPNYKDDDDEEEAVEEGEEEEYSGEDEEEEEDDDFDEGGDNEDEDEDTGGDEDWGVEGGVVEEEQTQFHVIEDAEEGKEPSYEQLREENESLKEKNESLTEKNESLKDKNESLTKENITLKRQLCRYTVDVTEEQTAQGGEGIGSLASFHQTIKVKKEYKKRVENQDKKLEELTAALERIIRSKRKTRGRGGDTVNPEKEKEELIRNLSTHNVRLAQSKIEGAGIGVFAMTTIRKGTKLFQINGEELSGETISLKETEIANELPEHVQTVVKAFLLPDDKGRRDVPKNGLSLALGVSFYLNTAKGTGKKHNVEFGDELDAFGFNTMITTRRIEEGEELLLSYDVGDTK